MTARTDSFEGLHVLLVTEDDARAQAIAKSLRERKAHVGDVRAGAKDPVALRGADLLVIDARRSPAMDTRVAEVRSDVRARWASVATIDYTTLAGEDGTVDLRALETVVSKLAGMDKALTERARKESSFETLLAPIGPTRTLRALALAGPTMHVKLSDGGLTATVDLANDLLVAAFAERDGQRYEAWTALARVLGMTDATVTVERRAHPAAMNIMEPVDQALESAAQERARAPQMFAAEERSEEISGLLKHRRDASSVQPSASANVNVSVSASASGSSQAEPVTATQSLASAAKKPAPARSRTLIGVAPTLPPGSAPKEGAPKRESFADVPTDPAAPGLLQRIAQQPANDSLNAVIKPAVSNPAIGTLATPVVPPPVEPHAPVVVAPNPAVSLSRPKVDDDDDFDGDGQEYDAGEVTVVADASQLDILRETLGRIDTDDKQSGVMPVPQASASATAELGAQHEDEPVLELSAPSKSAAAAVFGADAEPAQQPAQAAAAAPAPEARRSDAKAEATKSDPRSLAPKTSAKPAAAKSAEKSSSMVWWIAAVLVVILAVAAFAMLRLGSGANAESPADSAAQTPSQR